MQEIITFISHHPILSLGTAVVFALLLIVEFVRSKRKPFNITPLRTIQMINHDNAVIIDIRPIEAYRNGHVIDAQSITSREIQENSKKLEKFKGKPIIIVCHAGVESQKIAALLLKHGYNAYSLAGGMRAWSEAQMPLVKG